MAINSSKVSVILPCYNERDCILPLIEAIHNVLIDFDHEIVVVDDSSPDGTYQLVNDMNYQFVKTVLRKEDPGLAKSIRAGIEQADGDVVVVMDSDFNHQPKYLPQLIKNLEFFDCVSGSRFVYGGSMDSRARHLLSWIFNIFVRIATGQYVTDNLYGFWAMKASDLRKLDFDKIFWGFGDYCIRFMYYLQRSEASILQLPVVNGDRLKGEGNNRFLRVFWQYFKATIGLVIRERFRSAS